VALYRHFLTMRPTLDILQSGEALHLTKPAITISPVAPSPPFWTMRHLSGLSYRGDGRAPSSVDDPAQVVGVRQTDTACSLSRCHWARSFLAPEATSATAQFMVKAICDHSKVHSLISSNTFGIQPALLIPGPRRGELVCVRS